MATPVSPEALMNAVLADIKAMILDEGEGGASQGSSHYLAFLKPGIPFLESSFDYAIEGFGGVQRKNVDTNNLDAALGPNADSAATVDPAALATDAARKYASAENFSYLCDLSPSVPGAEVITSWKPETRMSQVYATTLSFSQVYNVEPDAETALKLERWRSLLQTTKVERDLVTDEEIQVTTESDLVKAYNEKMLAYYGELMAYNNARIAAMVGQNQEAVHFFSLNAPALQLKLRAAMNDWLTRGYKDAYDRIAAAIAAVEGRSFALLKERYKEDFARSVLTSPGSGANFAYTAPAPADFARSGSGWAEFSFKAGSFNTNRKFTTQTTSAGGGLAFGGLILGGSGGSQGSQSSGTIDASRFSMTFKLCRVSIYRPFFNLSFLKSGFWRFAMDNQEYKNTMLCNGKTPAEGLMPVITTDCIFIKDLRIDFGDRNAEVARSMKEAQGKGMVSFGPIFLGGKAERGEGQMTHDSSYKQAGLKVDGMQLVAFLCHRLDKCPDPNPSIKDWI